MRVENGSVPTKMLTWRSPSGIITGTVMPA